MFFSGSKKKQNEQNTTGGELVVVDDAIVVSADDPTAELAKLLVRIGMRGEHMIRFPTPSLPNASILFASSASLGTQVADAVTGTESTECSDNSLAATIIAGASLLLSGAIQFQEYWTRVVRLQKAQIELIKAVFEHIKSCHYLIKENEDIVKKDVIYQTVDDVIKSLKQHGNIMVELDIPGVSFNLVYNEKISFRTAATLGLASLPALILAGSEIANANGYTLQDNSTGQVAMFVAVGTPYAKLIDNLLEFVRKNESNLRKVFIKVFEELYVKPATVDKISPELVNAFGTLLQEEDALELSTLVTKAMQQKIQALEDPESGLTKLRIKKPGVE